MTWTRLSDDFPDRPELLECSRSARLLHVEAMVYANRQLTDGRIPTAALPRISDARDLDADVDELIRAGIWERLHVGALRILAWQDREHQEPAADVRAREKRNRDKQRVYRERVALHRAKDHSRCDPRHCPGRKKHDADDHSLCGDQCSSTVTGNATSNEPGDVPGGVTTSPPSPALPRPKEQGQGRGRRRCEHGRPLATDGTGCGECVEADSTVAAAPPPYAAARAAEERAS